MPGESIQAGADDNRSYGWLVPVVFLAAFVAFYYLGVPLLNDNDTPWHLATGTFMVKTHHLPRTDPFAYGNQNQPWILLSWLWDLVLGVIQHWFGAIGTFIFVMSVAAGLVAGMACRLLKLNIALPAVIFTTILIWLCLVAYVDARPQLVGYMLAFVFHALLHESRGDAGYRHLRWLPLLMLVWANSHGSFTAGFIIMGAHAVEAWFIHRHEWLKRIVIIGIACAACVLVNPYGPAIARGGLLSFESPAFHYTTEWRAFSFPAIPGISVWLVMAVLLSNFRTTSVPLADKILTMVWFLATMLVIRNGPFFIILSAPYLATCMDIQTRDLRKPQPVSPLAVFMNKQPLKRVWLVSAAVFSLFCMVAPVLPHDRQIDSDEHSGKDAINFALEHYPEHNFYTDFNFGGQIIYQTQGKLHFFMDSRTTAYSDEDMKDFINFLKCGDGWEDALHKHNINGIILLENEGFSNLYEKNLYHDHWKLVFIGKRARVYVAR